MDEIEVIDPGDFEKEEWYIALTDDCKAIITEAVFTSRWALVDGYHQLGERIVKDNDFTREETYGKKIVTGLSQSIGVGERTIRRAIQFYQKFPDIYTLPDGKNMTWTKVLKLLPEPQEIETPVLPDGKYSVIYSDPPWPVGSIVMDKWESPIGDKYPTMTLEQIASLPVAEHAADECSLFLWTTHTFLPSAFDIIKAWGFKYFCCVTWDKGNGWTQNGFHKRTEFLLYAYKGGINIEQHGAAIPTLISEARGEHSKKPDAIRDMIASKTPEPRLEMFAREAHAGWMVWGNEV